MPTMQNRNKGRDVRLNDLDWEILRVMADGKRYTQQYLYDDTPELDEYSSDWIRKRVSHLYDNALIQKVGTSTMYEITEYGLAALELEDDIHDDMSPVEVGEKIRNHAGS